MKQFAALYDAIDATTSTTGKVAALTAYFREAPPADAAWALAFLLGRRPKRLVKSPDLRRWAAECAGVPEWLFEECYAQAGDLAETIALLVPEPRASIDRPLAACVEEDLLPLGGLPADAQRERLVARWMQLGGTARFVFNKLLTGGFRVGVSDGLVVRALATYADVPKDVIAHRLMGTWEPSAEWFMTLVQQESSASDWSRPYPFFLAHPLDQAPDALGDLVAWQCEWKWDGIRAQLVRRQGATMVWSRGEELLAGRFPELEATAALIPDGTVLDGEILGWRAGKPLPFTELQKRINRRTVGRKLLQDVPCHLLVYDCLEFEGRDVRSEPLQRRRSYLEYLIRALPTASPIAASPIVVADSWAALADLREQSREACAEGLMLKRRDSGYGVGRRGSDWWKWKVSPLTVDAVLVYAQAGHGRRAGLYTDYTFALWDGDALVPFAKAYSGLTDAEIRKVDQFIRRHTVEKFGPVRTVAPELVFELAFEGIQRSTRHKSGVAVRFPRIVRWRTDKPAREADTLASVQALLPSSP